MMPKIGFGVSGYQKAMLNKNLDGIGIHTFHLFDRLTSHGRAEFVPISFKPVCDHNTFGRVGYSGNYKIRTGLSHFFNYSFFETSNTFCGVDIFHSPDHFIPRLKTVPVIATVHDVIPFSKPHWYSAKQKLNHYFLKQTFYWASHVITVSEFSKGEILKHTKIKSQNISVVYNGIDPSWFDLPCLKEKQSVISKFNLQKPYVLFVGTIHSRKNIKRMIDAAAVLRSEIGDVFDFVLVGRSNGGDAKAEEILRGAAKNGEVRWFDSVNTPELKILMRSAKCLLFPSLAEGFGMPVLEGFASNVPVITSNNSALQEIAGAAALLVDPLNVREIAGGLKKLFFDQDKVRECVFLGAKRAEQFSWATAAQDTFSVYEKVLRAVK